MATLTPFVPRPRQPFTWQPVLDGATVRATVTWNLFGQRWYVTITDGDGARVLTTPLVGSPDPQPVTAAAWDGVRQRLVVTCATPHGVRPGAMADLTLSGFAPMAFCGAFRFLATSSTALAAPMTVDPGVATVLGAVGRDVDMLAGVRASSLVYRTSSGNFEVTP